MLLIEVVSHFARILSLTVRLYANMFAGDMVTLAFFSLVPVLVPVVFLGLHFVRIARTDLHFCHADACLSGHGSK